MTVTDPIRQVSVVSTGQVQIRPDHLASSWRPTFWWLLASRSWTGPRPINVYVIEHVTSRLGGSNSDRNVLAACRACNNCKGSTVAADSDLVLFGFWQK